MKIVTLRSTADDCPTDRTCPSIHDVDTDPQRRYVISKKVTDVAEMLAFASYIGDGQLLGYLPAGFVPSTNPMLDRTRDVRGQAVRPDRQYVIVTEVTDPLTLALFAHLIATDEQLGYVPVHELLEV